MNKSKKICIIIAISLIVLGLILCTASCSKWSLGWRELAENIHYDIQNELRQDNKDTGTTDGDKNWTIQELRFPASEINSLSVITVSDNTLLQLNLGSDEIIVRYPDCSSYGYNVYTADQTLNVEWRQEDILQTLFNWNDSDPAVEIWLPASFMDTGKNRIDMETVSGDVTVSQINCREFYFSSVSADLDITGGDFQVLKADTVSGELDIEGNGQSIEANTVSGDIELRLTDGPEEYTINFDTVSGDISGITGYKGARQINVETASGDLELEYQLSAGKNSQ